MVLGTCELKTNTRHFDSPPKFFPSIHLSIYPRIYEHSILPAGHYSSWMKFFEFRSRIDQEIQRKDHSPESSLKWTKEGATETILLFHFVSGISALSTKEFQRWQDSRRGSSSLRTEDRSPTTAKLSWIRIKSHCYSTLSLAQCNSLKVIRGHAFLAMDLAPSNSSCDNNDDISDQRPIIGLNLYESPQYNPICRFYCSAITVVRWLNHHRPLRHINQRSLPLQLLLRYVSCVISFLRFPSHLLSSSHSTVHPSVGSKHSWMSEWLEGATHDLNWDWAVVEWTHDRSSRRM